MNQSIFSFCDVAARGNGGNPWNISVPPAITPTEPHYVRYCDDKVTFMDTYSP